MSGNEEERRLRIHPPAQKIDRRVVRSRDRLGDALIALIQEKLFDEITVQEVLDRAGVSRTTFYAHYRDKDDLFMSDVDEFLEGAAAILTRKGEASERVAPVEEFFAHVAEGRKLYDALVASDRIDDFMALARGHFARGIERRLADSARACGLEAAARVALSHALAGAMLSLLEWWIDRGMTAPPSEMDDLFHRMVWSGVGAVADERSPAS
jgi:AcrR family transcriptional regulator